MVVSSDLVKFSEYLYSQDPELATLFAGQLTLIQDDEKGYVLGNLLSFDYCTEEQQNQVFSYWKDYIANKM